MTRRMRVLAILMLGAAVPACTVLAGLTEDYRYLGDGGTGPRVRAAAATATSTRTARSRMASFRSGRRRRRAARSARRPTEELLRQYGRHGRPRLLRRLRAGLDRAATGDLDDSTNAAARRSGRRERRWRRRSRRSSTSTVRSASADGAKHVYLAQDARRRTSSSDFPDVRLSSSTSRISKKSTLYVRDARCAQLHGRDPRGSSASPRINVRRTTSSTSPIRRQRGHGASQLCEGERWHHAHITLTRTTAGTIRRPSRSRSSGRRARHSRRRPAAELRAADAEPTRAPHRELLHEL